MVTRKTGAAPRASSNIPPGTTAAARAKAGKPGDAAPIPYALAKERILAAIRAIPPGTVAAYGDVARRAGLPGRARLTARVLGDHDDPDLPWFRVLRAGGRIAFAEGSHGWREQTARLRAEGVRVEKGRVIAPPPLDDVDAALWGPPR